MKRALIRKVYLLVSLVLLSISTFAWSEHPLLAYPVLSSMPELKNMKPIEIISLQNFLLKEENGLVAILDEYEKWAVQNIPNYAPLPGSLSFKNTGNKDDIIRRFLYAIRLNPNAKLRLYLQLLPNDSINGRMTVSPVELTTLHDVSSMENTRYVLLTEGQYIDPLNVLVTANDEPDYGFDLGLFENNNTEQGNIYGFGVQPFGDPNLEYGSQAPFHMGFYHEASLVYFFGPFLKKTYPEYRISLFRKLSEYAFSTGNDYWGWRFMGWGMHYLGDLSMPYHTAPLPGVSPLKMIWINLKAMLGFPKSKENAVQLVSNRHSVLEYYEWIMMRKAYSDKAENSVLIDALKNPIAQIPYSNDFVRNIVTKESVGRSRYVDSMLEELIPKKLVSDPCFKTPGSVELSNLIELIQKEKGEDSIQKMTNMLAEILKSYSMHLRSYYFQIMSDLNKV